MERTIEQKLTALLKLQKIDSQMDYLKKVRGDLPEEVQDLEDEIVGYQARIDRFEKQITEFKNQIKEFKARKNEAEKLITKYKDQQMNVRNNREYEAITKEIESEELEITLSQKKMKQTDQEIAQVQEEIDATKEKMKEREKDLKTKQDELETLLEDSKEEEEKLLKDREKQGKNIEERLFRSYNKIRNNAINGLAVVMVDRGACGGCFNIVPPQRQVEVRERKKIIVCEHCGRILAGVIDVVEEEPAPKTKKKSTRKKKKEEEAKA